MSTSSNQENKLYETITEEEYEYIIDMTRNPAYEQMLFDNN